MNDWLARYGAAFFLGIPMLCYLAQALVVYRPGHRYGMTMMMTAYAFAVVGQYLDTKGI